MTPQVQILNPASLAHLRALGQQIDLSWEWNPFQNEVLLRDEFEIALLGGKYSGKSSVSRGFLLKGNPDLEDTSLINQSYIYHPNYRATILRRNQQDLDDFLRRFHTMAAQFGGRFTKGLFEFPSGAVIACGHLADRDAWQKYIGVENVRFVLEEAALIPDYELFDQIRTCCRSVWPEMRAQILLTSNFGGPGTGWIVNRYIEPNGPDGKPIPDYVAGQTIHELVAHPDYPDDESKRIDKTRVWMFSTYRDNPHAVKDVGYIGTLATVTDPKLRAAYLDGDWKAFHGAYFNFLPDRHTIPSDPSLLRPWWHRWGGIDVGYTHETAITWACRNPHTRQIHLYRELVASGTSYVQLGFELARRSLAELEALPTHAMTFFISPDAIRKVSEQKTIADLFVEGISRKLGPQSVHFPDGEIQRFRELQGQQYPMHGDEEREWQKLFTKIKGQRKAGITLRLAANDRIVGWQLCRENLRIIPIGEALPPFDKALYDSLYMEDSHRADQYLSLYRNDRQEVLPVLQIWQPSPHLGPLYGCGRLIESIPKARHADKPGENPEDISKAHFHGMDSLDSWRYLMMGSEDVPQSEPYEDFRDRELSGFLDQFPNATTQDKIQLNMRLEARWREEKRGGGRSFNVLSGPRAKRNGGRVSFPNPKNNLRLPNRF